MRQSNNESNNELIRERASTFAYSSLYVLFPRLFVSGGGGADCGFSFLDMNNSILFLFLNIIHGNR